MTIQFSVSAQNGMLNSLPTTAGTSAIIRIYDGTIPTNCATTDTNNQLANWNLASTWAGSASSGQLTLLNLPLSTTAALSGTATHFRLFASDGVTCHMQGTVGTTGSGADIIMDLVTFTVSQTINITGFTLVAPGS